jgi:Sulfotransferase family
LQLPVPLQIYIWGANQLSHGDYMLGKANKLINSLKNYLLHYKGPNPMKVIITGPPRSGTSFLAGLVVRMGFSPGPIEWLRRADQHNPYGYYESMPLMKIDHALLTKFDGNVMDPPKLSENWTKLCEYEKKQILKIVKNGGIEIYKGNMLVVIADLYDELFPNARWIMIYRSEKDTTRSILDSSHNPIPYEELGKIRNNWLKSWENSQPSSRCLTVRYEDFLVNSKRIITDIAEHLDVSLTKERLSNCMNFFKPRSYENK